MVKLIENGKPRSEIIREYELSPIVFERWVKQSEGSGSFKEKDNDGRKMYTGFVNVIK